MAEPNEMTFDRTPYESDAEMWKDINNFLSAILKNGYIATVHLEDGEVYVIRFDYDDEQMGTPYPYWMTPDEFEKRFGEGEEDG